MIPHAEIELDASLPSDHEYGLPRRSDISEEGFGGFRGTWWIGRPSLAAARDVMRDEARLVSIISSIATDPVEFEALARAVEGHGDALTGRLASAQGLAALGEDIEQAANGDLAPLDGLEVGVAGLVFALNAVGCPTAASCRGHAVERPWSPSPVIYLAADRPRAEVLSSLVAEAHCGLDSGRGLLILEAKSIVDFMGLAERLLAERARFVRRREVRPDRSPVRSNDGLAPQQGRLFEV